uniref:Uncharacterized protein n=1 Tax=Chromera velia CCMP2878 TaxID=1169474 RepID=A0A0G4GRY6_9ALVE|eukprot:Cvel_5119.t1-p1 / transcript=Cvel_5119.t1 / gene=Cvel_5119 / organism=Chromera_velia_CCMP2878 / gene_product=hypothetical protein / transcript_product=hypothetical protein / location=Cvel_scaffold234:35489-36172(-) / protein_length=228 / sequence_SO=supercontig / SO=protein_coding / is_pseudo=false
MTTTSTDSTRCPTPHLLLRVPPPLPQITSTNASVRGRSSCLGGETAVGVSGRMLIEKEGREEEQGESTGASGRMEECGQRKEEGDPARGLLLSSPGASVLPSPPPSACPLPSPLVSSISVSLLSSNGSVMGEKKKSKKSKKKYEEHNDEGETKSALSDTHEKNGQARVGKTKKSADKVSDGSSAKGTHAPVEYSSESVKIWVRRGGHNCLLGPGQVDLLSGEEREGGL